ncbi:MAG: alkaline phosphatase D family protein, partial [Planctomycetaceae bacterium]
MLTSRKLSRFSLARRQLILAGCSAAALPLLLQPDLEAFPSASRHRTANPFTLGVASGDPSPDGFVIWTRLAPAPLDGGGMPPELQEVRWEVAADDQFRTILQTGSAPATPQLGHSVHVEIMGLQPDSWYWYRFMHGDAVSRTGR